MKINQCFSVNPFENSTKKNVYFWKIRCVSKQYLFEKKSVYLKINPCFIVKPFENSTGKTYIFRLIHYKAAMSSTPTASRGGTGTFRDPAVLDGPTPQHNFVFLCAFSHKSLLVFVANIRQQTLSDTQFK